VIPSIIIICVIALYFKDFLAIPAVAAIFKGIRAGVSVLIFNAAFKIFKKVKKEAFTYILMGLAFLVSLLVPIDSIFIILGGALASILYHVVIHKGEAHAA
jgi:chromate transporter